MQLDNTVEHTKPLLMRESKKGDPQMFRVIAKCLSLVKFTGRIGTRLYSE